MRIGALRSDLAGHSGGDGGAHREDHLQVAHRGHVPAQATRAERWPLRVGAVAGLRRGVRHGVVGHRRRKHARWLLEEMTDGAGSRILRRGRSGEESFLHL